MIEAVNAVVANASLLRGSAEQASAARSFAANPARVQEVIQAPYVSPFIYVDVNYDKAVLQIRDSDTGDVLKQFPSEQTMAIRSRIAQSQAAQTQPDVPDAPAPQVNAQAQVAASALASTAQAAAAVSAPPTSGNVVVTA
jgi:FlaG protein